MGDKPVNVAESIADFVVDLYDQYGGGNPRPSGGLINFTVIHKNASYAKARADIEALLAVHGLESRSLAISPGPEERAFVNRTIAIGIAKSALV